MASLRLTRAARQGEDAAIVVREIPTRLEEVPMRGSIVLACVSASLLLGCSVRVGARPDSKGIDVSGLAGGYASVNGIRPYDGTIVEMALFEESRRSREFEVASLEVWPLAGLGVGLAGARAQLLFLDVGLGVIAYKPKAPQWSRESEEPPKAEEPGKEGGEAPRQDEAKSEAQGPSETGTTPQP
jgi:hypothetical protein